MRVAYYLRGIDKLGFTSVGDDVRVLSSTSNVIMARKGKRRYHMRVGVI